MVPSMPMLTTPDRSHMTPHNAAKPIGTAAWIVIGAMSGRTAIRYPDELEHESDHRQAVQELVHQRIVASPP